MSVVDFISYCVEKKDFPMSVYGTIVSDLMYSYYNASRETDILREPGPYTFYTFKRDDDGIVKPRGNGGIMQSKESVLLLILELHRYIEYLGDRDIESEVKYELLTEITEYLSLPQEPYVKPKSYGYVYLIKGENGRYKIGFSKNPYQRLASLRLSSCEDHVMIHTFYCQNPKKREEELHYIFKDKRAHSEWFDLSTQDVAMIKSIKSEAL